MYLSSCDAQCLSSVFLNEFTEGAVMTEKGRLARRYVCARLQILSMRICMYVCVPICMYRKCMCRKYTAQLCVFYIVRQNFYIASNLKDLFHNIHPK